jgi:hypothetical protein
MLKDMFRNLLSAKTEKQMIEEYLADAVDLVDLENRIRMMDRGEAPWQLRAAQNLRGWA